jgi:hypothetical protein
MGSRRLEAQRANAPFFDVEFLCEGCFRCDACDKYFLGNVPSTQVWSSIDRGCYLFERYCDVGLEFSETHPDRNREGNVTFYPYRPFRQANPNLTLKDWESNFIQHKDWIALLYKEASKLATECHERPLDTSLHCDSIVVKTIHLLAAEWDLDVCWELPRFSHPTSQLYEELIIATRQVGAKIDREVEATGQVLLCKCFSSGVPRHTDFNWDHRSLRR